MSRESIRENTRIYRARHYGTILPFASRAQSAVDVPDDIERRDTHEPCFKCGAAGECRHGARVSAARTLAGVADWGSM